MRRLIVTADDFGLCAGINKGVAAAMSGGLVSRVSLTPVGRAFDDAAALLGRPSGCGVGIHLVMTEERPLCAPSQVRSLIGPDGSFLKTYQRFCLRYAAGGIDACELERELRTQIERVLATGLRPEHLDTHCHLGILPACFELMVRLAQEYKISSLRLPLEPLTLEPWSALLRLEAAQRALALSAAGLLARRLRERLAQTGLRCADRVAGLLRSGALDKRELLSVLHRIPEGVTELVCHPGIADLETRERYGHWGYDWEAELRALTDAETHDCLAAEGIQLEPRLNGLAGLPD